jgi:hypothetical protein
MRFLFKPLGVIVMFYRIEESLIPLFADSYLLDANSRLLFLSLWGSEAAVQEFFARLTLPNHELGLRYFTLVRVGERTVVEAWQVKDLQKITAKTPASGILGALCHVWLYMPALRELDRSGGNGYLLRLPDEPQEVFEARQWALVKELSQIPLLDEWREELLVQVRAMGMTELNGSGVSGIHLNIKQECLVELVQIRLRDGRLTVPDIARLNAPVAQGVECPQEAEAENAAPVDARPSQRKRGQLDLLI